MQSIQLLSSYMKKIASSLKLYEPPVSELTAELSDQHHTQWIWCVSLSGHELVPLKCGICPDKILNWTQGSKAQIIFMWIDTKNLSIEKISPEHAEKLIYQLPDKPQDIFRFLTMGLEAGYFGKLVKPTFDINSLNEWLRYFSSAKNHVMVAFVRQAMMKDGINALQNEANVVCV